MHGVKNVDGKVRTLSDYDHQAEKNAEMLADYYSDLATEQIQENCDHENMHVDTRVRVRLPLGVWTQGQWVEEHCFDVEGYFVCYKCNKSRWVSIDVNQYIETIDDPHILDD